MTSSRSGCSATMTRRSRAARPRKLRARWPRRGPSTSGELPLRLAGRQAGRRRVPAAGLGRAARAQGRRRHSTPPVNSSATPGHGQPPPGSRRTAVVTLYRVVAQWVWQRGAPASGAARAMTPDWRCRSGRAWAWASAASPRSRRPGGNVIVNSCLRRVHGRVLPAAHVPDQLPQGQQRRAPRRPVAVVRVRAGRRLLRARAPVVDPPRGQGRDLHEVHGRGACCLCLIPSTPLTTTQPTLTFIDVHTGDSSSR